MAETVEEILRQKGAFVSKTTGMSMYPLLVSRRDTAVIRPVNKLKKYDVALYKADDKYILHRVLAVKDGYCVMRGDNTYSKERVPLSNIIGVAEGFYRKGKYVACNGTLYRLYAVIHVALHPARLFRQKVKSVLSKIKHKVFK